MNYDLFSLKGKHIVVTGVTGLIGATIAEVLANYGAKLTLVGGTDKQKLIHLQKTISKNGPSIHSTYLLDITSKAAVTQFLDTFLPNDIQVDGVVHCAMHRPGQKNLSRYEDVFEESLIANVVSSFLLWDGFSKLMAKTGGGSLVYIGSIYGKVSPDFSVYDGTNMGTEPDYPFIKEGMNGLSKYYANKFGLQKVRSNVIILGGVYNNQPDSFVGKYISKTSLMRMAKPLDIAGACIYLLSDTSQYVTGSELRVEGGFLSR